MGKTRYFFTSSNGSIRYPSNHVSQFGWTGIDRYAYRGTQNIKPGILTSQNWTDLSSESFYRVTVKDQDNPNQARVVNGNVITDEYGNII